MTAINWCTVAGQAWTTATSTYARRHLHACPATAALRPESLSLGVVVVGGGFPLSIPRMHCIAFTAGQGGGGTVKASHEVWSIQNGQGRTPRHAQPTCGRARVARCGYLAAAAVLVGLAVLTRLFGSVLLGVSLTAHAGVHAGQVHARTHCTYYVTTQPCPCMCMWCVHVRHVLDQFSSHVGQNTWR